MWGMIVSLVQGIVTGVVGPVFTYLGKKQDVTLDGFKAGTDADRQTYAAWLDYQTKIQALKLQANSWWVPRLLYSLGGMAMTLHVVSIALDSTVRFGCGHYGCLGVPPLPAPYDTYEAWVFGSLFVTAVAHGPVSAATAWLHRK